VAIACTAGGGRFRCLGKALEFRILGPLEVVEEGRSLRLGGAKQRALLAVLLLNAGRVVSVDRLLDDLWGERPPATAAHSVQVYVSALRKALGPAADVLRRRPPGYVAEVPEGALDLGRFERLVDEGRQAAAAGDPGRASALLAEALGLWRGAPLEDFAFEAFAQGPIARLEELRLAALEERIDADLALGRHARLVGELEPLVREHPLREGLRGLLVLALYRSGRQAEALEAYQQGRRALVEGLGIDPSPALQALERAMLTQDPSLDWQGTPAPAPRAAPAASPAPERSILLAAWRPGELDPLLAIAAPLGRSRAPHELILARLLEAEGDAAARSEALRAATAAVHERRLALGEVPARTAVFTSGDPGGDTVRLASQHGVDLLLLDAGTLAAAGRPEGPLRAVLEEAPCDVAVRLGPDGGGGVAGAPVLVPFGGGDHDWAALELGAWLASAWAVPLRLAGTVGGPAGGRDSSRLLASASLVVQQLVGIPAEPALVEPDAASLVAAAREAAIVVLGVSERWRAEGLGPFRASLATEAGVGALAVRRGVRPGGLTPPEGLTRYTWSLAAGPAA
jgi:DNA-binding SARP family transcriptional activator